MATTTRTARSTRTATFTTFQVAEASTGHITKWDNAILADHVNVDPRRHPQVIVAYEQGYLVSTWHNGMDNPEAFADRLADLGHSQAYIHLVMRAHRQGCKWLNLDRDAEFYDGLPTFDW